MLANAFSAPDAMYINQAPQPPLYGSPTAAGLRTPPYPNSRQIRAPTTAELLRAASSAGGGHMHSPKPSALAHEFGGLAGDAARQGHAMNPQGTLLALCCSGAAFVCDAKPLLLPAADNPTNPLVSRAFSLPHDHESLWRPSLGC